MGERVSSVVSLPIRALISSDQGPIFMSSSNHSHLSKAHLQISSHWRVGLKNMNLVWGGRHIQSIILYTHIHTHTEFPTYIYITLYKYV